MRKSTLARLLLFCYGLNFTGLCLSALTHQYLFFLLYVPLLLYISYWFNSEYFDKEEQNAVHNPE